MTECYELGNMTWPEFRAVSEGLELAVIPLGATEQHGPGGTFGMDGARAAAFARRLAERLHPRAVVAPCFPYSVSPGQMAFPGTISLSAGTMIRLCEQVALSLHHHGIRKIFFLAGHDGAGPVLNIVLANLKTRAPGLTCGWASISALTADLRKAQVPNGGHADEAELSESLFLAPAAVRTAALAPGDPVMGASPTLEPMHEARSFGQVSRNGAMGNQVYANRQFGATLVTAALDRLAEFLNTRF